MIGVFVLVGFVYKNYILLYIICYFLFFIVLYILLF